MNGTGIAIAISPCLQPDTGASKGANVNNLLLEDGFNFLQEDGISFILLE